MRSTRALLVLLPALAALAACGDGGGPRDRDAAVDPGIGPVTYVVTGVTEDGEPRPLVADTEVRIRFAGGKLTLTAGCNTMSGGYQLEETRLTVQRLAGTELGCEQDRAAQDAWLAGLFARPVQLTTGAQPTIVSGSTVLTMSDRSQVSPDKPLDSTHWVLDTILDGDVATSVPRGAEGFLRIDGGTVTVDDVCSRATGPVRIDGDRLVFGRLLVQTRPCPSPYGGRIGAVREVISGTATFTVEEDRLTITRGGHGLGFRAVLAVR